MERKILKIGNSLGISLPLDYLKSMKLDYGDVVEIDFDKSTSTITISRIDAVDEGKQQRIDEAELIHLLEKYLDIMKKHRNGD